MSRDDRLSTRVDPELRRIIKAACRRQRELPSAVHRRAIIAWLDRPVSPPVAINGAAFPTTSIYPGADVAERIRAVCRARGWTIVDVVNEALQAEVDRLQRLQAKSRG